MDHPREAPTMDDRRRQGLVLVVGLVIIAAVVFGVPLASEESPGGVAMVGQASNIHYQASLSCLLVGFGDMYWQGAVSFGCAPLVV